MDKLKVCVIGTGSISDYHLGSYMKNPSVELYGVYDTSIERGKQKLLNLEPLMFSLLKRHYLQIKM